MSLERLKGSILSKAAEWEGSFRVSDLPGTAVGHTGRVSKSVRARVLRIYLALTELIEEGRMAQHETLRDVWVTTTKEEKPQ